MKDFRQIYRTEGAYHNVTEGFRAWFLHDNYEAIAKFAMEHRRVLDLGCGEGCLANYLTEPELDGVDYSDAAIELNRSLFPGRYRNLYQSDLTALANLGIEGGSYDCIVCSLTLMYLEGDNLDHCLVEARRLLSPGGIFVATYPTVGAHRHGSSDAVELPPAKLRQVLEQAGFDIVAMEPICPFIPASIVAESADPAKKDEARRFYESARRTMTTENSYHFIIVGRR